MNLSTNDVTWPQLKGLYQVYQTGRTKVNLFSNPYFERLRTDKRLLRYKLGNRGIIEGTAAFRDFFGEHFLRAYLKYLDLFQRTGVQSDGRRPYRLYDMETLIYIYANKEELRPSLTTERTFSGQFFRSSKYLENNGSVRNAVLQILEVDAFPKSDPKENKWRLVIDCPSPNCILLCENLAALKYPDIAIAFNVELWYVGGNNTRILENIPLSRLDLPVYYMCDWDYDGLRIYSDVKRIMGGKEKDVILLKPYDQSKRLPVDSPYHNSKWKNQLNFSDLQKNDFDEGQQQVITSLIAADEWIEEESQDFETMLVHNCLPIGAR